MPKTSDQKTILNMLNVLVSDIKRLAQNSATKSDLENFVSKSDLKHHITKDELKDILFDNNKFILDGISDLLKEKYVSKDELMRALQ